MNNTTAPQLCKPALAVMGAAVMCSACATGCSTSSEPRFSGFIRNPPPMVQSPKVPTAHVWVHGSKRISEYLKYIIDPVAVTAPASDQGAVQESDLKALGNFFRSQMIGKLRESGKYEIVTEPGPGVLRVRTAITGVRPNKPGINVIPMARATGVGLGDTTVEAEFIDTGDGERIGVFTDHQVANRFSLATATKWGSAEEILIHWAQLLREAADNRWISGNW